MKPSEVITPRVTFLRTRKGTFIFPMRERGTFVINGELVFQTEHHKEFELHIEPKSLVKVYTKTVIDYYVNVDGGKILPETYDRNIEELVKNAHYSHKCEYVFDNIDEEYDYKKYIQKWKKEYKEVEIHEDIPFAIGGVVYSEYREITPLAQIGGEIDDPICNMVVGPITTLKEVCAELGIEYYDDNVKVSTTGHYIQNASHSGIHYAKFNEHYIFTKSGDKAYQSAQHHRGTYEECVRELKRYKDGIRKIVKDAIYVEENKRITVSDRKIILADLETLVSIFDKVEPMRKSQSTYYTAKTKLRDIIKLLGETK